MSSHEPIDPCVISGVVPIDIVLIIRSSLFVCSASAIDYSQRCGHWSSLCQNRKKSKILRIVFLRKTIKKRPPIEQYIICDGFTTRINLALQPITDRTSAINVKEIGCCSFAVIFLYKLVHCPLVSRMYHIDNNNETNESFMPASRTKRRSQFLIAICSHLTSIETTRSLGRDFFTTPSPKRSALTKTTTTPFATTITIAI